MSKVSSNYSRESGKTPAASSEQPAPNKVSRPGCFLGATRTKQSLPSRLDRDRCQSRRPIVRSLESWAAPWSSPSCTASTLSCPQPWWSVSSPPRCTAAADRSGLPLSSTYPQSRWWCSLARADMTDWSLILCWRSILIEIIESAWGDFPSSYRLVISQPQNIVYVACPTDFAPELNYIRNIEAIQCKRFSIP